MINNRTLTFLTQFKSVIKYQFKNKIDKLLCQRIELALGLVFTNALRDSNIRRLT